MIKLNNKNYEFDYVIFGSGAAGSTLAYQLSATSTVALVDIATKKKSNSINRSTPSYINKFSSNYTPTSSGVFGGNTELWSGKTYLITKHEIKDWPIKHSEIYKYSKLLADELNIQHEKIFALKKIDKNAIYHKSQRNILGNLFECFNLEYNSNIVCFEKATLNEIHIKDKKVIKINIDIESKIEEIKINKSIILCCGGLGNIPIYLKFIEKIIAKRNIPKTFKLSDHPHFTVGQINSDVLPRIQKGYLKNNLYKNIEECILVNGKSINYAFQVDGFKMGTNIFLNLSRQSKFKIIRNLALLFHELQIKFLTLFFLILKKQKFRKYRSIEIFAEEPKKSKSKIIISNKTWKNKMKKLDIFYQNPEINFKSLKSELNKYTKNNLKNFKEIQVNYKNIYTGLHPSCATPFKKNPKIGEVSTDLEVKGFKNLYILGTNIFPTNGVTNPTWTLMVLAKRLSKYLEK